MRRAPVVLFAVVAGLSAPLAPARGDFIQWKYNWARSPEKILSDTSNSSYVSLTDEQLRTASGDSDIVATNLKVTSDADPDTPATFTNKAYTLTLFLLDVESNKSGKLDFAGVLNGTVSAMSSNLKNTFTGQFTQALELGDNLYTVTIGPYTPPGPPGSSNPGSIAAHASVTITEIHKTPEPSTILLALSSAPLLAYYGRRRRNALPSAADSESR
jgi:hypothetical protein